MPTVNDVMRQKQQSLVAISASETAYRAIQVMNQHHVGAVVVMDDEQLVGIFTERDVLTRIVGAGIDPRQAPVTDVMTRDVLCCGIFTDLDEVAQIMQTRRIRHIPVRDVQDSIVGMVSIGDINAYNVWLKQATIENMTDYICGRA